MKARIYPAIDENIRLAASALMRGEVIGMPTETVYGLAGDAMNETALTRIFSTKERPTFDPLIVHVNLKDPMNGLEELARLRLVNASALDESAKQIVTLLIKNFWPGPLTLVLPKDERVPDLATSGLPTVAIRMPKHPLARALISACARPLAAPSANRFGRISPTSAQDVMSELGDRIDIILDGGPCEVGLESTVVAVSAGGEISLLRPGGTPISEIEKLTGKKARMGATAAQKSGSAVAAPGMLESHYAPVKTLRLFQKPSLGRPDHEILADLLSEISYASARTIGILAFQGEVDALTSRFARLTGKDVIVRVLSPSGQMEEAARNLFSGLRALDQSTADAIYSDPSPSQTGLGHAIADRLKRASHSRSS